jgi:predicted transposase YbfD/YdcC
VKTDEVTAIAALLDLIDVNDALLTIDAAGVFRSLGVTFGPG